MTRIVIIAALAGELKPLVRGWSRERRAGVDLWRKRQGTCEWVGACAGAGAGAAARAFSEVERDGKMDAVVSAGWAGALRENLTPGKAYRVTAVLDARTGERFRGLDARPPASECLLVTHDRVADLSGKRRLAAAYGADLVDMEAAPIARLAASREFPFIASRGSAMDLTSACPISIGFFCGMDSLHSWGSSFSQSFARKAGPASSGWPATAQKPPRTSEPTSSKSSGNRHEDFG